MDQFNLAVLKEQFQDDPEKLKHLDSTIDSMVNSCKLGCMGQDNYFVNSDD